eukprot:scaffold259550_cov33-Tisochrysis_lutea.AAC.1
MVYGGVQSASARPGRGRRLSRNFFTISSRRSETIEERPPESLSKLPCGRRYGCGQHGLHLLVNKPDGCKARIA